MKGNQAAHSIATMCRVLGVSASGYYAWQRRDLSPRGRKDHQLLEQIRVFHHQSRGTYGAPRIHRDLRDAGERVGRKRVARLLKQAGLRGVSRRKWPVTTVRAPQARPAPDLGGGASRRMDRISCGSPTLPTSRPRPVRCTWRSYLTCGVGGLSAGGWRRTCERVWSSARSTWPSRSVGRNRSSIIRIRAANTRRSNSGDGAERRPSDRRWGRSGTAMTTRCVRASSRRSSASCSIA